MLHAKPTQNERAGQSERDGLQSRFAVEGGNRRGQQGQHNRQSAAQQHIDPEQRRNLGMSQLVTLDYGRGQPRVAKEPDKACHDGGHANEAVVSRRQQPGQHGGGPKANDKFNRLSGGGHRAAPDGTAFQILAQMVRGKEPGIGIGG